MDKGKNYPLVEVAQTLGDLKAQKGDKCHFFQKFTCSHCGSRQTMADMDKLYASGVCEECGWETDIAKAGCNYMLWLQS